MGLQCPGCGLALAAGTNCPDCGYAPVSTIYKFIALGIMLTIGGLIVGLMIYTSN